MGARFMWPTAYTRLGVCVGTKIAILFAISFWKFIMTLCVFKEIVTYNSAKLAGYHNKIVSQMLIVQIVTRLF